MAATDIASVYYLDGVAIEENSIYIATQLETLNPRETAHTRMSTYAPERQEKPFGYHDFEDNIVSVHAYRLLPEDKHRFVGLGRHGLVHFRRGGATPSNRTEQIPGAGMLDGNFGGPMTHIREIGGHLWACGHMGQVYRRFGQDDWRHVDQGLFVAIDPAAFADNPDAILDAANAAPVLDCIDGSSESDVYAVGMQGFMAHFDGRQWRKLELPTDEHLNWVRCYGTHEVWVCGYNGTLLKGNARDGFKDMSGVDDNQTWVCLSKFNDQVYLSAEEGLYVFDGKSIQPVKTALKPELQDAWRVDHADGVLWSIGVKDLARFDGTRWERVEHPDNERIGE
jgi:hypothetical protein